MAANEDDTANLYADGWRQGSIFHVELTVHGCVLGSDSTAAVKAVTSSVWVIASQDCDLAAASPSDNEPIIEVRPVVEGDAETVDWGIRSHALRLDEERSVVSDRLPGRVSPALLHRLAREAREPALADGRVVAFKTWLGLRFDRPAVPDHLVPLARDIAKRLRRPGGREVAAGVHDVLMQFDESGASARAVLFAVMTDDADRETVLRWLADVAKAVPAVLGVVVEVDAGTKAETSLELIETSYTADASQITWRGADPDGAV
jgi:hypothetical protein